MSTKSEGPQTETHVVKRDTLAALTCRWAQECSGCDLIDRPYDEQKSLKVQDLRNALELVGVPTDALEPRWIAIASGGLRDRADLIVDSRDGKSAVGLFRRAKNGVLDFDHCPQFSPSLQAWLTEFRTLRFGISRGSVRLRVSPRGERGVWLDFANVDIKRLLDEGDDLRRLKAMAFVEIGQKRKVLIERDGQLKLGEPEPKAWFETYHPENERAIPVFTAVGGFTQPGFEANRVLVREVTRQVRSTGAKRAAEFGSGSGNLTFPLASLLENGVDAYESDELALRGLRQGAIAAGLSERIRIKSGDYQRLGSSRQPDFENVDLVLADPPRSGLMQFLDPLLEAPPFARPTHFVYVSCFAESFARDARRLCDSGYRLLETSIVDQFPQSPHYEVVVRFRRST